MVNKHRTFQYLFQLTLFIAAFGLVFFILQRNRTDEQAASTLDDKSGMPGLSRGEMITLPELSRLGGNRVSLSSLPGKHLLVGFFSATCSACSRESKFWRTLYEEATKRNVAFYLVAIDGDQEQIEKFAKANEFADIPVLVDRTGAILKTFRVSNVPMYLLLTSEGQVRERWVGLSHTNTDDQRAKEPADFFSHL